MISFWKMISLDKMNLNYVINKHLIWEETFWVSVLVLLPAFCLASYPISITKIGPYDLWYTNLDSKVLWFQC